MLNHISRGNETRSSWWYAGAILRCADSNSKLLNSDVERGHEMVYS